ncbi:protachykinin-1 [Clupea harengus]|uniref:Protachykinin-1 n=1 Tax=Clupea harengus TaxID=7950 RepID=A0A6P8ELK9_CLUHA|nr:protachykinin-1 [Clupea harengus]
METWKLLAVVIPFIVLVYSVQGISFTLDRENWISKNWQEEPVLERLADQEESLVKRSKARQFYGLMGRRSGKVQPVRLQTRRHKGGMFVGLMGRRALDAVREEALRRITPGADTSSAADMAEESNKHLDLEEQWEKLQYY